ncbi:MAG: biopolymer transporter ExbD [Deltaproteobacteria bacterium]|nr:biopolymer transporter ExbD [Deltaproteobacteria bacterium]
MKRLVDDEDLNLQDLIFILLFFFIIAQTLIVFKMETDVIVLPKVDDRIKKDPDEDKDLITILIDHKSTVTALIAKTGRDTLVKGLEKHEREEVLLYCDPTEGKDEFLKSEKSDAYKEIVDKIKQIKEAAHFFAASTRPHRGSPRTLWDDLSGQHGGQNAD